MNLNVSKQNIKKCSTLPYSGKASNYKDLDAAFDIKLRFDNLIEVPANEAPCVYTNAM